MGSQKIGIVEIIRVASIGSGLYLRIPKEDIDAFGLKKGDLLRVKIEELIRNGET